MTHQAYSSKWRNIFEYENNDVSEEERIKHNVMRMESEESPKFKNCVCFFPLYCFDTSIFCVQSFKDPSLIIFFFLLVLFGKEKAQIQAPPIKIPYS